MKKFLFFTVLIFNSIASAAQQAQPVEAAVQNSSLEYQIKTLLQEPEFASLKVNYVLEDVLITQIANCIYNYFFESSKSNLWAPLTHENIVNYIFNNLKMKKRPVKQQIFQQPITRQPFSGIPLEELIEQPDQVLEEEDVSLALEQKKLKEFLTKVITNFEENSAITDLVNLHLKHPKLKNNVGLQRLITHIGNCIKEKVTDKQITKELIEDVITKIYFRLKISNEIDKFKPLPLILDSYNHLEEFIKILVNRYVKRFNQLLYSVSKDVLNNNFNPLFCDQKELADILQFNLHENVRGFSASQNCHLIATIERSNIVRVFDLSQFKTIYYLKNQYQIKSIELSTDGKFLVVEDKEKILLINLKTKKSEEYYKQITNSHMIYRFSDDNRYLALMEVNETSKLIIYDLAKQEIIQNNIIENTHAKYEDIQFSTNSQYLGLIECPNDADDLHILDIIDLKTSKIIKNYKLIDIIPGYTYWARIIHFDYPELIILSPYNLIKIDLESKETKILYEQNLPIDSMGSINLFDFKGKTFNVINALNFKKESYKFPEYINNLYDKEIFTPDGFAFCLNKNALCIQSGKILTLLITNNYLRNLNYKQLQLLKDLAIAKKISRGMLITLNDEDKNTFDSLPILIKLCIWQNLALKDIFFDKFIDNSKKYTPAPARAQQAPIIDNGGAAAPIQGQKGQKNKAEPLTDPTAIKRQKTDAGYAVLDANGGGSSGSMQ